MGRHNKFCNLSSARIRSAIALLGLALLIVTAGYYIVTGGYSSNAISTSQRPDTEPSINLSHIFDGEINRHGKPVGLHVAPAAADSAHAQLKKILSGPNRVGVYTAIVRIFDPNELKWKEKFSSIFPDRLSRQEIIAAILNAVSRKPVASGAKWRGPSGRGFMIEGYQSKDGTINTAYPLYVAD
ncbi:EndoU domain-containing protein [Sneathiella sp.]|uniref:EndoU domain-containing protein n=1 Tax=Sneathiella sp. TaxID=1964365 RepID=UPI0035616592